MKEIIDFDYFNDIPIEDICDVLGIKVVRGKFLCPCHNDNRPSTSIDYKRNRWKCFSCGEGGTGINLVMAYVYNVSPSEYYKKENKGKYKNQFKDTIHFLDKHFPGGIKYIEDNTKENTTVQIPTIPNEIIKAIGLKRNPLFDVKVVGTMSKDENRKQMREILGNSYGCELSLPMSDRALILLDALQSYENRLIKHKLSILKEFPDFDDNAKEVVKNTINTKMDYIKSLVEQVRDYYFQVSELEYDELEFDAEALDVDKELD